MLAAVLFICFCCAGLAMLANGYFIVQRLVNHHSDKHAELGSPSFLDLMSSLPRSWQPRWNLLGFIWLGRFRSLQDRQLSRLAIWFITWQMVLIALLVTAFILAFNDANLSL